MVREAKRRKSHRFWGDAGHVLRTGIAGDSVFFLETGIDPAVFPLVGGNMHRLLEQVEVTRGSLGVPVARH